MITADTITEAHLRGLLYAYTFSSPVWNAANDALHSADPQVRALALVKCAAVVSASAEHQAWVARRDADRSGSSDPRGPYRAIVGVEQDENGGPTRVSLSCGHVRPLANHFSYRVGDSTNCWDCRRVSP